MNYSNNIISRITPQEVVAILATTDPVALRLIRTAIGDDGGDLSANTDNEGQVIIYTGLYRWNSDGLLHDDEPEDQSTLSDDQKEELADAGEELTDDLLNQDPEGV